jgi:3-deoxy-7-phosphoheptulonate synthase
VEAILPAYIDAVGKSGHPIVWICDPMHGNTKTISMDGKTMKTRYFSDVAEEMLKTFQIHRGFGSFCSGIHLEASEDPVTTECIGGLSHPVHVKDLLRHYTSSCDPRLNARQVMDLIWMLLQQLDTND